MSEIETFLSADDAELETIEEIALREEREYRFMLEQQELMLLREQEGIVMPITDPDLVSTTPAPPAAPPAAANRLTRLRLHLAMQAPQKVRLRLSDKRTGKALTRLNNGVTLTVETWTEEHAA